ncbi:MAG: hypothetical protein RIR26_1666 [Pseudomonadota bacterium]|jgi:maleamate amidohydrolase
MSKIHSGYEGVFDKTLVPGTKPALLVVDVIKAYTDPTSPFFTPEAVEAVAHIASVIKYARSSGHPIVFTRVEYKEPHAIDGGLFVEKVPALKVLTPGSDWAQYCDEIVSPQSFDDRPEFHAPIEIIKQYPSAFFETSLAQTLTLLGCDSVFILGFSTSGCVRATAVDAMQLGFRPFVISECVADKSADAHRVSLLDIQSKYGEIVTVEEAQKIYDVMRERNTP